MVGPGVAVGDERSAFDLVVQERLQTRDQPVFGLFEKKEISGGMAVAVIDTVGICRGNIGVNFRLLDLSVGEPFAPGLLPFRYVFHFA